MARRIEYNFGDKLHPDTRWTFLFETERHYKMPSGKPERKGLFICECGNLGDIQLRHVRDAESTSCGCAQQEFYKSKTKHGLYKHEVYSVWEHMMQRCNNPKNKNYRNYGGRGIQVCDRWSDDLKGFIYFLGDMGDRPSEYHSIDRINTNGNYDPDNCRWSTSSEQAYNRRVRSDNKSGVPGVNWEDRLGKWKVTITKHPDRHYLGVYQDFKEAVSIRKQAEIDYWGYQLNY